MSAVPESIAPRRNSPRALLLGVRRPEVPEAAVNASTHELRRLAETLGIEVVGIEVQRRPRPSAATFVGRGKLASLARRIGGPGEGPPDPVDSGGSPSSGGPDGRQPDASSEPDPLRSVDLVLVDAALTPRQQGSLEQALEVEVLDRTGVILEIFERRARTREARIEVEIARLRYDLPRRREGAAADDRRGGGGRGGRGQTNLALDRERTRTRIAELTGELETARAREAHRRVRGDAAYRVVLVGYTNAGKSSLMRGLTGSKGLVEDRLFATLGTRVRRLMPPSSPPVSLADTVGFVRDLPHELVASFRSTLDEALDADLLLVVVDASDPDRSRQLAVTRETLDEIGAGHLPRLLVLNKMDRIGPEERVQRAEENPEAVWTSAHDPDDLAALRDRIIAAQERGLCEESLRLPYREGALLGEIHARARVVEERHDPSGTLVKVRASPADLDRWRSRLVDPGPVRGAAEVLAVARDHGLDLSPGGDAAFDESGLDFRVLRAMDRDGQPWIVRTPRRPEVFAASRVEARALRLLRSRLPVDLPEWRLHTPMVIAYPMLPGTPVWTLREGGLTWNAFEPSAPPDAFLDSIARTLAGLQAVPRSDLRAAGIPVRSVNEVRAEYRRMLHATLEALAPEPAVVERWSRWLEDEAGWPDVPALVHGDLHPGHLLVDSSGRVTGVLDWTEVQVAEPGRDLSLFLGCFGEDVLRDLLARLRAAGARVAPNAFEHAVEGWAFNPVPMAAWALAHGNPDVLAHARTQLAAVEGA